MKDHLYRLIILTLTAFWATNSYCADEVELAADQTRNCVSISRIKRIEIVDNQTLIFHLNHKVKYINRLPFNCPGLKSRGTFLHETSLSSYCDLDTITVIDASLGMRMGSCPLGKFEIYKEAKEKKE